MSKKITLAIFLLTVLTFSTVASSYAAFEVSPRESDMRTTSIFNDDLYVQQISAPAPTSSPYAQRILNQEVPQVKEKTLLGALLFSKYGKPVLGSQISYQRKLSNDPNAIRLSQTRSILRDDTTLRDYYLSNTVKNNKYFGRVRTQSNWGGRVTSRRALYSGTGLSYQRLLSKEAMRRQKNSLMLSRQKGQQE